MCLQDFNSMPYPRRLLPLTPQFSRRVTEIKSDTPSFALPGTLDVLLAACSKSCLGRFIADNYPSSNSTNILALCTTKSASGFTLGEAALICESAYCGADGQVDKSIFSICASIPQAIRPSHQSLTVVPMATSQLTPGSNPFSSALPSSIGAPAVTSVDATKFTTPTTAAPTALLSVPSTPNPSSTLSTTTSTSSSPAPSSTLSAATSSPPSFPSSQPSSAQPSSTMSTRSASSTTTQPGESDSVMTSGSQPDVARATSQAQENLNAGQIVGISLAALAILGIVIGVLMFWCYRRRERGRNRRGSRWSEVIDKQPPSPFSPTEHQMEAGLTNARAQTPDHSQRYYAAPTAPQEKRRSFWRRSVKPEDIGVALSPEIVQAGSPNSISSQRTTSQLLPELPNCSLWPAPLRQGQQILTTPESRREVARPTVTFPSTFVESKTANKPVSIIPSQTRTRLPPDPPAQMYKLEQAKGASSRIPLTPVYDNGNFPTTVGVHPASEEHNFRYPGYSSQLCPQRTYDPRLMSQMINPAREAAEKFTPTAPSPAHLQATPFRQAPPLRRNSSSSDATTFEDDEDTTPEQEHDKQLRPARLSPVLESPHHFPSSSTDRLSTSLTDITYPSPPRPAAISKQAEKQPRPRAAKFVNASITTDSPAQNPKPGLPRRKDQFVLEERSFFSSASSSSLSSKREESPSSLLAKRKGDKAADQMLQRGLRLSSTAANAPTVNKWQVRDRIEEGGRRGSDTENCVNVVMKTPPRKVGLKSPPIWTPRLTPTRMGEDLYLRVD